MLYDYSKKTLLLYYIKMLRFILVSKVLLFFLWNKLKFVDEDNYFWYQCVDFIRYYLKEVFGYTMPSLSKALLLSEKHLTSNKRYEVRVGIDDMKLGDVVSVNFPKPNEYWHIFVIHSQTKDGYYYYDQNGIGGAGNDVNGVYPKIKGNWIEKRFAKWSHFRILRCFRYKTL